MRIHIEGMGVNGCLIATRLMQMGVTDFTWSDNDSKQVAWRASTGAIYPGGSLKFGPDHECHQEWARWKAQGFLGPQLEAANYVFSSKRPPHDGSYKFQNTDHDLRVGAVASYHLNAQLMVNHARNWLADKRIDTGDARNRQHYIVSHGFGLRLGYVYWGWTRLVRLEYDADVYGRGGLRPAFYFRPNKYVMAYAYPAPGTPYWYAGSSILKQATTRIHELEVVSKYERWEFNFEDLAGGAVKVVERGPFSQGWRPAARAADVEWVTSHGGTHTLRPLWNSGIRHFPKQWRELKKVLNLEEEA